MEQSKLVQQRCSGWTSTSTSTSTSTLTSTSTTTSTSTKVYHRHIHDHCHINRWKPGAILGRVARWRAGSQFASHNDPSSTMITFHTLEYRTKKFCTSWHYTFIIRRKQLYYSGIGWLYLGAVDSIAIKVFVDILVWQIVNDKCRIWSKSKFQSYDEMSRLVRAGGRYRAPYGANMVLCEFRG